MAEDVNAPLLASTLERAKTVRKSVEQIVEIPFWCRSYYTFFFFVTHADEKYARVFV